MSDTVTPQERAYIASLPSDQEQDEAAERRYQLEQSPLARDLVRFIAYVEAVHGWRVKEPDVAALAERLLDVLGSVEDPYQIAEVLK